RDPTGEGPGAVQALFPRRPAFARGRRLVPEVAGADQHTDRNGRVVQQPQRVAESGERPADRLHPHPHLAGRRADDGPQGGGHVRVFSRAHGVARPGRRFAGRSRRQRPPRPGDAQLRDTGGAAVHAGGAGRLPRLPDAQRRLLPRDRQAGAWDRPRREAGGQVPDRRRPAVRLPLGQPAPPRRVDYQAVTTGRRPIQQSLEPTTDSLAQGPMADTTPVSSDPWFQTLFADRVGGAGYGRGTEIYKFEKIKRAKRAALAAHPGRKLLDFGIGENDDMADPLVREYLKREVDKLENRGYADNGIAAFKEAAAGFMKKVFGV